LNEFVAGFLGASNFLDGSVVSHEDGIALVETVAGRVHVRVARDSAAIGTRVRLAVRPERVRMNPPDGEGLSARVRDIVYRGSVTHFYMDGIGGPLLSYSQNANAGDWSVGDDVRCAWDMKSAVLVAREPT